MGCERDGRDGCRRDRRGGGDSAETTGLLAFYDFMLRNAPEWVGAFSDLHPEDAAAIGAAVDVAMGAATVKGRA